MVDLDQQNIRFDERFVQALEKSHGLVDLRRFQAQRERQLAGLPRAKSNRRINLLLKNCLRILAATSSISMPPACEAINTSLPQCGQAQCRDKARARSPRSLQSAGVAPLALRPGLVSHQRHSQNVLAVPFGVFACLRHLHAAAFAAASRVNLSLHHHARRALGIRLRATATASSKVARFLAFGHGNAILRRDSLCLILVILIFG